MMQPVPRTILISGASSGFGELTARTLSRQGHTVFAGMRQVATKNVAAAARLASFASRERLSLHAVDLDVTDDVSVQCAVAQILDMGHLDVVVNNAGVLYFGPLEAFTPEQAREQLETNVVSVLRLNRAVLPHMRARRSGLLLQVGSILGRMALPFSGLYAASKFALEGLTEAYRLELADHGVEVAIVEPGRYSTGIAVSGVPAADESRLGAYPAADGARQQFVPSSRAEPQEVADAIAHLINAPAGSRPLRTVVATGNERFAAEALNAASDRVMSARLAAPSA